MCLLAFGHLPWGDLRLLASAVLVDDIVMWYCQTCFSRANSRGVQTRWHSRGSFAEWWGSRLGWEPCVLWSSLRCLPNCFRLHHLLTGRYGRIRDTHFCSNLNAFKFSLKSGDSASWLAQQFEERLDTFGCIVNYHKLSRYCTYSSSSLEV